MNDSDLKKYLEPSLYRVLCVERNATPQQIKQNYRGMQKVFHPDKNKDNLTTATEKSTELNFAYTVLSNSTYKTMYDRIHDDYYAKKEQIKNLQEVEKKKRQQEEAQKRQAKMNSIPKTKVYTLRKPVTNSGLEALQDLAEGLKEFMDYMKEEQKRKEGNK